MLKFVLLAVLLQGCASSNPYYDPNKPHHREDGFVNSDGTRVSKPFSDLLRWYRERWGETLPPPPGEFVASYDQFPQIPFTREQFEKAGEQSIAWLGHASVLVNMNGLHVLTDPHFTERASPYEWIGPKRRVPAPVQVEGLPRIDVVLISHNHYDHLDEPTIRALVASQPDIQYLVPLGVEPLMRKWGVKNIQALDWWDKATVKSGSFTFVPAYHWAARSVNDRNASLWGGWVSQQQNFKFYYAGDTGFSDDFAEIAKRYGPFDVAAIPVGAYEPRWFMKEQHVNPAEAVLIHRIVGAKYSIGVHWGTFELTDEPLDQPMGDLPAALKEQGLPLNVFELLASGQVVSLPRP